MNEDIDKEIVDLEATMYGADFWNDKEKAHEVIKKIKDYSRPKMHLISLYCMKNS